MTHRDRIVGTLLGTPVDRPPLCWWLGFKPWDKTLERWRTETGISDLDPATEIGLDPFFEPAPLEMGPFPRFDPVVVSEDDEFITSLDYRGIKMRNRRDAASMPEWIGHPVSGPRDWETYKRARLAGSIQPRLHALEAWCCEMRDRDVPLQIGDYPWGVFGTLRDLLGTERCLLAFYDEPEMVRDIIDTNVALWISLFEAAVARAPFDLLHLWEDMSGRQGSLISPAMVEEFMMPAYDRVSAFARAHGIPLVSVDTDGQVDRLLPVMMAHGVNAYLPFEVQAGNDVLCYRRRYPALSILGGLDKSALARGRTEIHRELDRAEAMFAAGRWIAGFDHLIPPDVSWGNYRYAMHELKVMLS